MTFDVCQASSGRTEIDMKRKWELSRNIGLRDNDCGRTYEVVTSGP